MAALAGLLWLPRILFAKASFFDGDTVFVDSRHLPLEEDYPEAKKS